MILLMLCSTLSFGETGERKISVAGIVIGTGMVAGGAVFSVYNYQRAKVRYKKYEKSAFTENTTRLRSDIRKRNLFCVLGGVLAGMGAIGITVSF